MCMYTYTYTRKYTYMYMYMILTLSAKEYIFELEFISLRYDTHCDVFVSVM